MRPRRIGGRSHELNRAGFSNSAVALIWGYVAVSYSLIRPPRILVRVIRSAGKAMMSGSSRGARRSSPCLGTSARRGLLRQRRVIPDHPTAPSQLQLTAKGRGLARGPRPKKRARTNPHAARLAARRAHPRSPLRASIPRTPSDAPQPGGSAGFNYITDANEGAHSLTPRGEAYLANANNRSPPPQP